MFSKQLSNTKLNQELTALIYIRSGLIVRNLKFMII